MAYLTLPAIRIHQPLGDFWVTKLKASQLLDLTYSSTARLTTTEGGVSGSQRELKENRVKAIGRYIDTVECAFPNSIIIAANYFENGLLCEDEEQRWQITAADNSESIVIPSNARLAAIIDGQHRVNGFRFADTKRMETELLCAIYLDLPNPYQAYLFATINFNQKKVDKSLAYELFGYNLDDELPESWSPDKLAVYLSRKLNFESSPFNHHILVAPQDDHLLGAIAPRKQNWYVSAATVIDGILTLYSKNPSMDRDTMHKYSVSEGRKRLLLTPDGTPLRNLYLQNNDVVIYKTIYNYFSVVSELLFKQAPQSSYIFKTVGIQALFDVLKNILEKTIEKKDISENFFLSYINKLKGVDFSNPYFQTSGIGRNRIKNTILVATGLIDRESLLKPDEEAINGILGLLL